MANRLTDDNTLMVEYNYAKNKEFDLNTLTLGSEKKIKYGGFVLSVVMNGKHKLLIEIMEQIVQNVEKRWLKFIIIFFFIIIIFPTCNSIKCFFTNNLMAIHVFNNFCIYIFFIFSMKHSF